MPLPCFIYTFTSPQPTHIFTQWKCYVCKVKVEWGVMLFTLIYYLSAFQTIHFYDVIFFSPVCADPSQISVPPSSYFLNGTNHSLTCETTLEYTQIFWKNESSSNHTTGPLLTLTSVNITTEGEYTCEVLIDSKTISEATVAVHVLGE